VNFSVENMRIKTHYFESKRTNVFNTAFNLILISLLMLSIFQKINGEKGMFAMQSSLNQLKSIQINSKLMNSQVLEFLTLN
jgi:cell division protein FtsB